MKDTNLVKLFGTAGASLALASVSFAGEMVAPAPAPAPPPIAPVSDELGFTLSVGYDSDYMFRGVRIDQNLVWAGLDYEYAFTDMVGINLGAWYATIADSNSDYEELDLYGGLNFNLTDAVTLGVGYIAYIYPGDSRADDTGEIYGSLGYEFQGVGLELYYGYDHEIEGGYAALTAGYSFPILDMVSLDFSAGVSYTHDYNFDGDGFNNVDLRLAIPIALTSTATLEPYIAGSIPVDKLDDAGETDRLYGGVSLSVSF